MALPRGDAGGQRTLFGGDGGARKPGGEHCLHGLRNRDLAAALGLSKPQEAAEARRQSARVTRKLHLLHAHGLLAKIPRSRRWRVTARGAAVMSAAIHDRERALAEEMLEQAA